MPEAIISLQQQQQSHDKRDLTIGLLLACWLVFSAVILGALSMSHVVAFPEPEESAIGGLIRDLNAMRRSSDGDFAVHVIAKDCSCTESLFRHLMKNGPADQAEELVLFVGEDEKKRRAALAAGYRYKSITQDDLTAMGLESAPVLALFDDKDEIHYLLFEDGCAKARHQVFVFLIGLDDLAFLAREVLRLSDKCAVHLLRRHFYSITLTDGGQQKAQSNPAFSYLPELIAKFILALFLVFRIHFIVLPGRFELAPNRFQFGLDHAAGRFEIV